MYFNWQSNVFKHFNKASCKPFSWFFYVWSCHILLLMTVLMYAHVPTTYTCVKNLN